MEEKSSRLGRVHRISPLVHDGRLGPANPVNAGIQGNAPLLAPGQALTRDKKVRTFVYMMVYMMGRVHDLSIAHFHEQSCILSLAS
jgi:hypothetical protein